MNNYICPSCHKEFKDPTEKPNKKIACKFCGFEIISTSRLNENDHLIGDGDSKACNKTLIDQTNDLYFDKIKLERIEGIVIKIETRLVAMNSDWNKSSISIPLEIGDVSFQTGSNTSKVSLEHEQIVWVKIDESNEKVFRFAEGAFPCREGNQVSFGIIESILAIGVNNTIGNKVFFCDPFSFIRFPKKSVGGRTLAYGVVCSSMSLMLIIGAVSLLDYIHRNSRWNFEPLMDNSFFTFTFTLFSLILVFGPWVFLYFLENIKSKNTIEAGILMQRSQITRFIDGF
jgi:DNA-directed RNA polymerase subunit RPC12/RpoP